MLPLPFAVLAIKNCFDSVAVGATNLTFSHLFKNTFPSATGRVAEAKLLLCFVFMIEI